MSRPVDTEEQLTGASKMVDHVKNLPPWMAIVVMIAMGGGGGLGVFQGYGAVMEQLDEIQKTQVEMNNKLINMEWRVKRNSSRLDGQAEKNRDQDKALYEVRSKATRLETVIEMRGNRYE